MIGRLHHLVIDTADPAGLAEFYSELVGWPVTFRSPDWVVVSVDDTSPGLAFQLASDHQAPRLTPPLVAQQMHWDVMVDDLERATTQVLAAGATVSGDPAQHIFLDPAGHPFCLVARPGWAAPVVAP